MSNRIQRTAVLTISRATNYAVLLFSPILLVRILEMRDFGQYREFVLYAILFSTVLRLDVYKSIFFFVPKSKTRAPKVVTNTLLLAFVFSLVGVALLSLFRLQLLSLFTFDFVTPLLVFVFLSNNLDYMEVYWLSIKRSDLVLYYTAGKLVIRVAVVVSVAYLTRSVEPIILSLIVVEFLKCLFAIALGIQKGHVSLEIDLHLMRKQIAYSIPLGLSELLGKRMTREVGKFFVVTRLGAEALALYAVATYTAPVVGAIKSSIIDVIFPDMVARENPETSDIMDIWQRATVLTCTVLVPVSFVLIYFAEDLLRVLFTETFVAATLIFQIYCVMIIRDCFEFESVLRAFNKTGLILAANLLTAGVTIGLLVAISHQFEGAAIATVVAAYLNLTLTWYIASRVSGLPIGSTAPLRPALELILISSLATPVLFVSRFVDWHEFVEVPAFSLLFLTAVIALARSLGGAQVKAATKKLLSMPARLITRA